MTTAPTDLASLLGSRLCHDLISPIGAISNGVELLKLSGGTSGPELDLISQSVDNANARIKFFRVAFGAASKDHFMSAADIRGILDDLTGGTRINIRWAIDRDLPRDQVKLGFLLIQCFEVSLPWGGEITLRNDTGNFACSARSERIRYEPDFWGQLKQSKKQSPNITASEIQFLILSLLLKEAGKKPTIQNSDTEIRVAF